MVSADVWVILPMFGRQGLVWGAHFVRLSVRKEWLLITPHSPLLFLSIRSLNKFEQTFEKYLYILLISKHLCLNLFCSLSVICTICINFLTLKSFFYTKSFFLLYHKFLKHFISFHILNNCHTNVPNALNKCD